MVKHALIAVATAAAFLVPGGAAQAVERQQCPVVCGEICDTVAAGDVCTICLLPENSPVVPCFFGG
ncbi:MAG TPA: hypothetical protein VGX28_07415 [Frankiaceae bacterium]|jgi:hypothetical protein|nr:hypothetical protein [Frankiaceae bacterium]